MQPNNDVKVIGIYGLPGSGKSKLLAYLKQNSQCQSGFTFFEGSEVIDGAVPGGLDRFQGLSDQEKVSWRKTAIRKIREDCLENDSAGVVAGHFMFWPEEAEKGDEVCTEDDWHVYTHIIYLDVAASTIMQRCLNDKERNRQLSSVPHLEKWKEAEIQGLRSLCLQHQILFHILPERPSMLDDALRVISDFRSHNEKFNLLQAQISVDKTLEKTKGGPETVLVFDGDKTLIDNDTGEMFWESATFNPFGRTECPLKTLFSSKMGYSYSAFRQATLLYEEGFGEKEFEDACREVVESAVLRPELKCLLQQAAKKQHIHIFVISCGLRKIWENLLHKEGIASSVDVIAGGRLADGFVVTAKVKAELVKHLQQRYGAFVWAFGDSPLDMGMLAKADEAVVVVGTEQSRSKSMTSALQTAIDTGCVQARQLLIPCSEPPRIDTRLLPQVSLSDPDFIDSILDRRKKVTEPNTPDTPMFTQVADIMHATERHSAKLLMTPMRDACVDGPRLRKAHFDVGRYLATEMVAEVIGTEEFGIRHVQGQTTNGFRLLNEQKTVIIALMRGGEPMAFGVSEVFPLAMFIHAAQPEDIQPEHLAEAENIMLVDSVVNNGTTAMRFAQHVRRLRANAAMVLVAGVIQKDAVLKGGLANMIAKDPKLDVVALRLSENKYTGKGGTDTGNRLFSTTHLSKSTE